MTTSRTFSSILRENVFTLFNVMLSVVALFVLSTGSLKDCLFVIVIFVNSSISIITEVKAKRTLDKLTILIEDLYTVTRDDQILVLKLPQIQVGDIVTVAVGQQIPADGEVVDGYADVDESVITGESVNISKQKGDSLFSASVVFSGEIKEKVSKIGEESNSGKLSAEAKKFQLASSDLRDGINKILKYISFGIVPVALLLVFSQMRQNIIWKDAILHASAGIVGMIPEGLVLLTSLNFALSCIILAKKHVLVSELNSVETLARVNELILDKTGTITDGNISVESIYNCNNTEDVENYYPLHQLSSLPGGSKTSEAIKEYLESYDIGNTRNKITDESLAKIVDSMPFSSASKYCEVTFINHDKYKLGAPEVLLDTIPDDIKKITSSGKRVLVVTKNSKLHQYVVCQENIRESIKPVIKSFLNSGVNVRVVSGDNLETVQNIAQNVGIDPKNVVGRALPSTKLEIVQKLQKEGKVVAMTGDGVNDILALKYADLGIAMANGAPSSKAVANIVLLNNDFAIMSDVIAQGRRVIANIERVASLFLVKTFYSISLTLLTILFQTSYPFLPRHLTIVSALTIGIPAFFLALPPNNTKYRKGFLNRVMRFSMPFGIFIAIIISLSQRFFPDHQPTLNVLLLFLLAFSVLICKSRPLLSWRIILVLLLIVVSVLIFLIPPIAGFFAV